ncbi:ABC transporter permease [Nakamurella silvestris]|nr:ABC transporter permease [Nakamurella silvestris]
MATLGSQDTDIITASPTVKKVAAQSEFQLVFRRFIRHKAAMGGLILFILIFVLAFSSIGFGPIPGWWKWDYRTPLPTYLPNGAPTLKIWPFSLGEHPFGQDNIGRDFFALTMRGLQQSLIISVVVGVIATLVGTLIGALAGYYRGWTESVLMRFTDVMITIPTLAIAAVLVRKAGNLGIWGLALFLGLVIWTGLARIVRGEFLSLREKEFVEAARSVGASGRRIIFRHILPNTVGVIIVSATLTISSAILLESALSFLGFGVQAPDTSLGKLIQDYRQAMTTRPQLFWWPGSFIVLISLAVNFIGDGLRDAFDPRQKRMKA